VTQVGGVLLRIHLCNYARNSWTEWQSPARIYQRDAASRGVQLAPARITVEIASIRGIPLYDGVEAARGNSGDGAGTEEKDHRNVFGARPVAIIEQLSDKAAPPWHRPPGFRFRGRSVQSLGSPVG
jgi:hypothetical protein